MAPTLKPLPFDYDVELQRIKNLIGKCRLMPSYEPDYEEIRGFVIMMEQFLINHGYNERRERREARLGILSIITGRKIRTTYDLMANEVPTIRNFLTSRDTGEITRMGEIFLIELAGDTKTRVVAKQRASSHSEW